MEIPLVSATRRHHAIEHATIAVLFQRRGRMVGVLGQSDPWGFTLRGRFDTDEVEAAAREAIERLAAGEAHLALTHLCGTNVATGAVLAGGAAMLAAGNNRRENWTLGLCAALVAMAGAGRAGLALQQHLTTDALVGGTEVRGVRSRRGPRGVPSIRVSLGR